jgi:hypothetical protein
MFCRSENFSDKKMDDIAIRSFDDHDADDLYWRLLLPPINFLNHFTIIQIIFQPLKILKPTL